MTDRHRRLLRICCMLVMAVSFLSVSACSAEEGFSPAGDWAFNYQPDAPALLLREDGTAVYQDTEYRWEDDGTFLLLTDGEGPVLSLRYLAAEGKFLLYLPKVYVRVPDIPGEGLTGAWIGQESEGSTFIFTEDRRFLEDGTFTGTYQIDPEAETFLLVYPKYFDDTLCYFRMEGNDTLIVEYPWPLVERQEASP